jgi:hypothetical protein
VSQWFTVYHRGIPQDDHGNTVNTATSWDIAANRTVTGSLEVSDDWDVFEFTPPTRGTYTFTSGPSTGDVYGVIYDEWSHEITHADSGGGGKNFRVKVTLDRGQYFVAIRNADQSSVTTGAYTITATSVPTESLTVSRSSWAPPVSGGSTTITVKMSLFDWRASHDADWLHLWTTRGWSESQTVTMMADPNYGSARSTVVTFAAGGLSRTVTVSQAAAPAPTLTLSRSSWSADASGASIAVSVRTNQRAWVVCSDVTWLTVDPPGGLEESVHVTAAPNPGAPRIGRVTFIASGPRGALSTAVTVTQGAATVTAARSSWAPSASGATTTSKVTTSQPTWAAASDAQWLTVVPAQGASGEEALWAASANTGARRTATITLTAGDVSTTVTVTQAAGPSASLSLSKTTWVTSAAPGSIAVEVSTNQPSWSFASDESWLTATRVIGPAGAPGTHIVVSAEENPSLWARTGTLTVTAGTAVKTLAVTQAAGRAKLTLTDATWLADGGHGLTFAIAPTIPEGTAWTAKASGSWITLSPTGSQPAGTLRLATLAPNTSSDQRIGTITVTTDKVSTTFTVVQQSLRPVQVSRSTWAPSASGASTTTTVTAQNHEPWVATTDADWLLAGRQTGPDNRDLVLVARPNPGPARRATVTVESGGTTAHIVVTQAGAR